MPPQYRRVAILLLLSIFAHAPAWAEDEPLVIAVSNEARPLEGDVAGPALPERWSPPEAPQRDGPGAAAAVDDVLELINSLPPPPSATTQPGEPIEIIGVTEPESARTVDLTQRNDDLWDRVRRGFAIANLENSVVDARTTWLAERPDQVRVLVERGRRCRRHFRAGGKIGVETATEHIHIA